MRISDFGSGFGSDSGKKDRREAFRRKHAQGQRVVGVFLRWQSDGLAWLEVDGQPLLAQIGGSPEPGQRIHLLVKQLHPDIVLQEITSESQAGSQQESVANSFLEERGGFEAAFHHPHNHGSDTLSEALENETVPERRRELFFNELERSPKLKAAYEHMLARIRQINLHLAAQGGGEVLFMPWLLPMAREVEFVRLPARGAKLHGPETEGQELGQCALTCLLPNWGRIEIRVLHRDGKGRVRFFLERPNQATREPHYLETLPGHLSLALNLELEFGGVAPLPPKSRPLLASMLVADTRRLRPRFSTVV